MAARSNIIIPKPITRHVSSVTGDEIEDISKIEMPAGIYQIVLDVAIKQS